MKSRTRTILTIVIALILLVGLLIAIVLYRGNNDYQMNTNEVFSISNGDYLAFDELYDNVGWMGQGSKAFSFELTDNATTAVLTDFSDGNMSSDYLREWTQEGNEFRSYLNQLGDNTMWDRGAFSNNESYIYIYDEATNVFYLYVSLS